VTRLRQSYGAASELMNSETLTEFAKCFLAYFHRVQEFETPL